MARKKRKKKTPSKLNAVQYCDGEVRSGNVFQALESAGTDGYINDQNVHISLLCVCIKFTLSYYDSLWVPARSLGMQAH